MSLSQITQLTVLFLIWQLILNIVHQLTAYLLISQYVFFSNIDRNLPIHTPKPTAKRWSNKCTNCKTTTNTFWRRCKPNQCVVHTTEPRTRYGAHSLTSQRTSLFLDNRQTNNKERKNKRHVRVGHADKYFRAQRDTRKIPAVRVDLNKLNKYENHLQTQFININ